MKHFLISIYSVCMYYKYIRMCILYIRIHIIYVYTYCTYIRIYVLTVRTFVYMCIVYLRVYCTRPVRYHNDIVYHNMFVGYIY